jgi:hypothetical protein
MGKNQYPQRKDTNKMKKNSKSMGFIILAFIFIFSTGQVCTIWEGFGDGQGNGNGTEQEADEEENGEEEDGEEEDD